MAKNNNRFVCQSCGSVHTQWMGQCSRCGTWNSIVEEKLPLLSSKERRNPGSSKAQPTQLQTIQSKQRERLHLDDEEFNRVSGGGLVPGSVLLIGGEPGIGKSTLMLQLAMHFAHGKVLYVSGEESPEQVKLRADRLGQQTSEVYLLAETNTHSILEQMHALNPGLCIVDSIQTLHSPELDSAPGTVSQIREASNELIAFAKQTHTPLILIGHITKEGSLAGPKVLEHMVDVVLQFEGDRNHVYRLLRAQKNRFGSTAELGIYEMVGSGLRQVSDPSEILISRRDENLSGVAIGIALEGARPMLIETQSLVSTAVYGTPQRSTTGFDARRLNMLLAVLEKRCGFRLATRDVFLNITGGLRIDDPAMDLAVVAAILSSAEDMALPTKFAFTAEVGLGGELRPVSRIDQRLAEASKLGYETCFISKHARLESKHPGIKIMALNRVDQVFAQLFG